MVTTLSSFCDVKNLAHVVLMLFLMVIVSYPEKSNHNHVIEISHDYEITTLKLPLASTATLSFRIFETQSERPDFLFGV